LTKRILFLTPQLPYPPRQGTILRNYGLINGLAQRGHQVSLLTFTEPSQPPVDTTPLIEICEDVSVIPTPHRSRLDRVRDLVSGKADMAGRLWSVEFEQVLQMMLKNQQFDVVHIEGIEMAPYIPAILASVDKRPLLIYDAHNAEYALQKRISEQDSGNLKRIPQALYSRIQAGRLHKWEANVCNICDHVFAVSETDAQHVRELTRDAPITVIPNAIEVEEYSPENSGALDLLRPALVFTGKMDFRPNVDAVLWFASEILPRIHEKIPDAHFYVVGQKPHSRLEPLREKKNITLTGFVDKVQPYIASADVYVAPLRMGSGTRFKLLEAMAMSCSVVSTRIGAEGLDVQDGKHLLLADDPQGFAAAVVALIEDDDKRKALGSKAADLVSRDYDWPVIIPDVEAVYTKLPSA